MPHPETSPFPEHGLREIEAEFRARPEHAPVETAPALITIPSELEFQQMAAEREAREAAEHTRREAAHKEWREREKLEKRKGRIKKALAVAAVVMTFKSGGLIDMTGDQFSDAGNVAADAVKEPVRSDYLQEDEIDGIAFEDYSKDVQAEMRAEADESVERDTEARDSVIELFETVDKEGYDGIKAEVAEQRAAHPELYVSEERANEVIESIENSGSNDDTVKVLGEFLGFYGIEAGFHDGQEFSDREEEVREIARAWVDVLAGLPKDFVALSAVERATVSNEPVSSNTGSGTEMGVYSPDRNEINVVAMSGFMSAAAPVEGFLERSDFTYQGVVAHELGHALDEQLPIGASLPEGEQAEMASVGTILEHIGRGIINRPEAPTLYAHTSDEEYGAELLSGVLSDRSDGLASTDEWRKFGSASNKEMIAMLVELEGVYPGIAKVLVANRASS
jgi:hypothetical protein